MSDEIRYDIVSSSFVRLIIISLNVDFCITVVCGDFTAENSHSYLPESRHESISQIPVGLLFHLEWDMEMTWWK